VRSAGGFDDDLRALAAGEGEDGLYQRPVARVHRVVDSQKPGRFQPLVVDIHGNERIRSARSRAGHDEGADSAYPNDRAGLALVHPAPAYRMEGHGERLRPALAALPFQAPRVRYVSAVDACAHESPDDIRETLVRQLSSPVRWPQTLRALIATPVAQVIECGPGRVLTGLNRRIERRPDLAFLSLDDQDSIAAALAATRR